MKSFALGLFLYLVLNATAAHATNCFVRPHGPFGRGDGLTYADAKGDPFQCMSVIDNGGSIIVWGNPWDDHDAYAFTSQRDVIGSGTSGAVRVMRGATPADDAAAGNAGVQQCPWLSGFATIGPWFVDTAAGSNGCGTGRRRWYAIRGNANSLRQYDLWERKTTPPAQRCRYDANGVPTFLTDSYNATDYHRGTAINNPGSGKSKVNAPGKWTQGDAGETERIYYCPIADEDANRVVIKAIESDKDRLVYLLGNHHWLFQNFLMGGVSGEDGSGNQGNGALLLNGSVHDVTFDRIFFHSASEGVVDLILADSPTNIVFDHVAIEYAHSYGMNGNNVGGPQPNCGGSQCVAARNMTIKNSRIRNTFQHGLGLAGSAGGGHKNLIVRDTTFGPFSTFNSDGEHIYNNISQYAMCMNLNENDGGLIERITCTNSENTGIGLAGDDQGTSDGSTGMVIRGATIIQGPDNAVLDEGGNCIDIGQNQPGSIGTVTIENVFCDASAASQRKRPSAYSTCFWMFAPNTSPVSLTLRNNICVTGLHSWAAVEIGDSMRLASDSVIANNTFIQKGAPTTGCNNGIDGGCGFYQQNTIAQTIAEFSNNIFVGFIDDYKAPSTTLKSCRSNIAAGHDDLPGSCAGTRIARPSFLNLSAFNAAGLHLAVGDTVAIDAGVALTGFNTDFDGDSRPQGPAWDIGADELSARATLPPPTLLDVEPVQ